MNYEHCVLTDMLTGLGQQMCYTSHHRQVLSNISKNTLKLRSIGLICKKHTRRGQIFSYHFYFKVHTLVHFSEKFHGFCYKCTMVSQFHSTMTWHTFSVFVFTLVKRVFVLFLSLNSECVQTIRIFSSKIGISILFLTIHS